MERLVGETGATVVAATLALSLGRTFARHRLIRWETLGVCGSHNAPAC